MKTVFFLFSLFATMGLAAEYTNDSSSGRAKLYLDSNDLEISENSITIHLEDDLIETNILRSDQQGLYIFESDITNYDAKREKTWKCPYCYNWWPFGQKCKNPECPTNQW